MLPVFLRYTLLRIKRTLVPDIKIYRLTSVLIADDEIYAIIIAVLTAYFDRIKENNLIYKSREFSLWRTADNCGRHEI